MEPLLLNAGQAAELCSVGESTWRRLCNSGMAPEPIRLGRRTFWKRTELLKWIESDCPPRDKWEKMKNAG